MSKWPTENIPDKDHVFRNAKDSWLKSDNTIDPQIFWDSLTRGREASVFWDKYCTKPSDARLAMIEPERYGVLKLNAGEVRELEMQIVEHKPTTAHRAHSLINGEKDEEILFRLLEISELVIPIPPKKPATR